MNPRPADYESAALPLSYPGAGDSPYHRPLRLTSPERPAVVLLLPLALLAYAVGALAGARWWISGLAAPLVGALLWYRHPRARFAAYVFFSVVALRGLLGRHALVVLFAAGAIVLMQTAGARRAWPRLRRGATRAESDRMPGP